MAIAKFYHGAEENKMSPKPATHDRLRLGKERTLFLSCLETAAGTHLHSLQFAGQWNQSRRKPRGHSCERVASLTQSRSEVLPEQLDMRRHQKT